MLLLIFILEQEKVTEIRKIKSGRGGKGAIMTQKTLIIPLQE